jgi:hypothetical protein
MRMFSILSKEPITMLETVQALIAEFEDVDNVRLHRGSLLRIEQRLLSWRLMDSCIALMFHDYEDSIRQNLYDPLPPLNIHKYHKRFLQLAQQKGLLMLSLGVYRKRMTAFPKPVSLKRLL